MRSDLQHTFRFISLVLVVLLAVACNRPNVEPCNDYREAMRDFMIRISETARTQDADFVVIPQNGIELVTMGDNAHSELAAAYLSAIDGHGQELPPPTMTWSS